MDYLENLQSLINFPLIIYVGMCIEPPSPYEIKSKYLEIEYKDMEVYVNIQKEKWKIYRCTIKCDGWIGPTKLSISNFMVYSKEEQFSSNLLMRQIRSQTTNKYMVC